MAGGNPLPSSGKGSTGRAQPQAALPCVHHQAKSGGERCYGVQCCLCVPKGHLERGVERTSWQFFLQIYFQPKQRFLMCSSQQPCLRNMVEKEPWIFREFKADSAIMIIGFDLLKDLIHGITAVPHGTRDWALTWDVHFRKPSNLDFRTLSDG